MNRDHEPAPQRPRHELPGPGDPREPETRPERMMSGHQTAAGSARGVGSVGFDDPGAFDVGAETRAFDGAAGDPSGGPLETGSDDRAADEPARSPTAPDTDGRTP